MSDGDLELDLRAFVMPTDLDAAWKTVLDHARSEQLDPSREAAALAEEREELGGATSWAAPTPRKSPDATNPGASGVHDDRLVAVRAAFPALDLIALVDPNRPARRDFLAGMIPEGEHASIVAPAGTGKSLLALALAVAAALGAPTFLGQAITFAAGARIVYIDMENSEDDLSERLASLGVTPANVAALAEHLVILHMPHLRGLDTREGGQELADVLDAYGIGAGDLLVLDSTQRVTEGDENANDTLRRMYGFTSAELKRRGVTVLRTDNTGWGRDRERGASAKRDDVGASWLLVPSERDPELFSLVPTKRRSKGTSDALAFRRFTDDAGLLHFDPAPAASATSFADSMRSIRDLLTRLDIPLDLGHSKVWAAVQAERQRCEKSGEDFPAGVTQKLVRKAHDDRRQVIVFLPDDPPDDLPPTDYDGGLK